MMRPVRRETRQENWCDGKRPLSVVQLHKGNNRRVKYRPHDGGIPRRKPKAEMRREEEVRKASEGGYVSYSNSACPFFTAFFLFCQRKTPTPYNPSMVLHHKHYHLKDCK